VNFLGVENLVLTNSCTSAITLALKISGVGPGAEVITTPMTCIATNTPIINLGANIVWADITSIEGNIDYRDIEKKISKNTKAIVYVDWGGTPAQLEEIHRLGLFYKIPVIQDAAHAFGARWDNQPISNFADFTCYSFQAIKHLSSGDGGAIVTNKAVHNNYARKLKWFGYDRDEVKDESGEWKGQKWDADIKEGEIGYKFNMNNIAAAIGLSQLNHIESILNDHRSNAEIYARVFSGSEFIKQLDVPQKAQSSFWVFTCLISELVDRDKLLFLLNSEGIGAGLVHLPNDNYSAFSKFKSFLPQTRKFQDTQISFPCGWWLSNKDCEFIAEKTLEVIKSLLR
jgi:dTDP-4-amino-4,6-dideoxygalactose transaminase